MDGLFAGTPPLEALRHLIHEAATVRSNENIGSKVLMINDVARAFFEAPAKRNICVEIPKVDRGESDTRHDKVGHLRNDRACAVAIDCLPAELDLGIQPINAQSF